MLFLIEYNREKGKTETFKTFDNANEDQANRERLALELALNRKNINNEAVLLRAASEDLLRHTHQRYFDSFEGITNSFIKVLSA